jgi:hypothetical protein
MWNAEFSKMLTLVVMASLLRVAWELSRQRRPGIEPGSLYPSAAANPDGAELTPQQREWAEKAVKRYAEAQEKKWRRWNEVMFERSA